MRLFSPAKVNLFLNVLRKRKDGYHELQTLFERLDLGDTLDLSLAPRHISLKAYGEKTPSGVGNLVYQAARLLKKLCGVKKGVRLTLHKRIPVSAGLGGGSSNAAATLIGLDRLWKLGLSQKKLLQLGARLGSDVPFFILQTSFALGAGRGERLKKVSAPGVRFWHVLVKPPFGSSTKEAYQGLKPPFLTLPKAGVRMLVHSIQKGDSKRLSRRLTNSLEVSLNKRVTIISKIKKQLREQGSLGALLSGSGSSVFGLFLSKPLATKAARNLRKAHKTWKVFVTSTY